MRSSVNKPFKKGDRVAFYTARGRFTGTVDLTPYMPYIVVSVDKKYDKALISILGTRVHPKQCRRLVKASSTLKPGDRVKVYGQVGTKIGYYYHNGETGTVDYIASDTEVGVALDNGAKQAAHPKQCRKLTKRSNAQ